MSYSWCEDPALRSDGGVEGGTSVRDGGGGASYDATHADGGPHAPQPGDCPPLSKTSNGWAAIPGLAFEEPTSGGSWNPITVTTAEQLQTLAAAVQPRVILISGTIEIPVLDVSSNKTIRGADAHAMIKGGIRIAGTSTVEADMASNVVIQNLTIDATTAETNTDRAEQDAIMVSYAHHVWIDHVDMVDAPGDLINILHGSDYITVSWSSIRYVNDTRRTAVRIGHADNNAAEDTGRLKVTMHHNWWGDAVAQRMPRVRFGDVHVYNNYYSATANVYAIAAALDSRLVVENNYFDGTPYPHVFFSYNGSASSFTEPTAEMVASGNTYVGAADAPEGKLSGQGPSFVPPYPYELEPADAALKGIVQLCAGPH